MLRLDRLSPQPAGFGNCTSCSYRDQGGSAAICFACAASTMQSVSENRCMVCDQALESDSSCANHWCRRSEAERGFKYIFAIAMRTGELEAAINRYKFRDRKAWAAIFGRVLVGYLDEHPDWFDDLDLIVGSPAFTGPGARRSWDHVGTILDNATVEGRGRWPFDRRVPRAIVKTVETPSMMTMGVAERRAMAETDLRAALVVPDPSRISGASVLVFDDVFTDGTTLREIALALRGAGARSVAGIVLARQPWRY